ncbi:conserved protein of unknown function [Tenacibaculum sp. 190130A14a]|uniref:Outer membrane protein beta-barrel domain-containing protein n=1 Tax=Tenacibaculum polynesiense TaxID=3137857 RepID=A0ABM9PBD8_9FLAO
MKRILFLVLFVTTIAQSQEKNFEEEVRKISIKIERITKEQKDSLKTKVKEINLKASNNEITQENAVELKKKAAEYHAQRIEQLVGVQEIKLQGLVQDKVDGKIATSNEDENTFSIGGAKFKLDFSERDERKRDSLRRNKRTTTQIVFALGVNNVLENHKFGSLNDSEYKFWQSHFYELGFTWKTRLSKEASKTYFKYGFSFLWNNLRAEGNKFHEINGDQTVLNVNPNSLSESRLRHVQMTFPMHLEFDFSKNRKYSNGQIGDRTHKSVRFGIGGFVGFKLGTRQYLEYVNTEGVKVEEVQKSNFNMNTVNYGLSAYFGYRGYSLYAKYDLNPLFKDTDTRNISLGVRFDIN